MKLRVKLFAVAKELVGNDELVIDVPAAATISDVRRVAERSCPALSRVMPHAMWAVDASYATDATTINEKSEVALIPPVSGG